MGTRSLTIVKDERGKRLCTLYRQYDGSPDYHGEELRSFLEGKKLCNGISYGKDNTKLFNGMGCLAASLVAHFKQEIGGFYLMSKSSGCGEDYIYTIYPKDDTIIVKVKGGGINERIC